MKCNSCILFSFISLSIISITESQKPLILIILNMTCTKTLATIHPSKQPTIRIHANHLAASSSSTPSASVTYTYPKAKTLMICCSSRFVANMGRTSIGWLDGYIPRIAAVMRKKEGLKGYETHCYKNVLHVLRNRELKRDCFQQ